MLKYVILIVLLVGGPAYLLDGHADLGTVAVFLILVALALGGIWKDVQKVRG